MSDSEFQNLGLDLVGFDPARTEAATCEQEARGIVFTTLAEEQGRRPTGWLPESEDSDLTRRGGHA